MNLKILNRILAILILILNIYFLPFSFITIKETGGAMGYGLLSLPLTLLINFLIITSVLALNKKYEKSLWILIINFIGFLFAIGLFFLLMLTPRID